MSRRTLPLILMLALFSSTGGTLALAREGTPSLDMAGVLFQQGRYGDAAKEYRRILKENPSDLYAYLGLSQAYKAQGNLDGAQAALQGLISRNPTFAPAYYNLGSILEAKGDRAGARQAYQQFVRYSNGQLPSDPEIMIKLRQMGLI